MAKFVNTLWTGDNLFILNGMNSNSVDLIYLDPPFNSKRLYSAPVGSKAAGAAFKDTWTWQDVDKHYLQKIADNYPNLVQFIESIGELHSKPMMSYITYMIQRIIECNRILKDTGNFYLHCDQTASHYLKIILDRIFGKDNFRNEIVWYYKRWTNAQRNFQKMNDKIFFYSKSKDYFFEIQKQEYSENTIHRKYSVDGVTNLEENRDIKGGIAMSNVWSIPYLHSQSKERIGYPTQKPLALMHRIIKASSKEGDIVMDPFCGCATTCVAAQQLGRKWIGMDISEKSADIVMERLADDAGLFSDFINRADIPQRADIKIEPPNDTIKERLYKKTKGSCFCGIEYTIKDLEIDHIIPKSKGGGDYYENYQLLCGNCNRIKGDRPQEWYEMRIKKTKKARKKITY